VAPASPCSPYRPTVSLPSRPRNGRVWIPRLVRGVAAAQATPPFQWRVITQRVRWRAGDVIQFQGGLAPQVAGAQAGVPLPWNLARKGARARWRLASTGYPPPPAPIEPWTRPVRATISIESLRRRAGRVWLPQTARTAPPPPPPLILLPPGAPIPWNIVRYSGSSRHSVWRLASLGYTPLVTPTVPHRASVTIESLRRRQGRVWAPTWFEPGVAPPERTPLNWSIARLRSAARRGSAHVATWVVPTAPQAFHTPLNWSIVSRHGERRALARAGRAWSPHVPQVAPTLGYHVYSNRGTMWYIDYDNPIATVYDLTWTSGPLSYPDTWQFGVRAFNQYGEEQNLDCYVELILDANGNNITNRPNPPTGLRAFATAGGGARVEWIYPRVLGPTAPTGFHVYIGAGATPAYGTPAATVGYGAAVMNSYVANLTGLSNGVVYAIGVRAFNATAEEPNTNTVSITASNVGPTAVVNLSVVATAQAG
jgi:hypothetical protein